jgi:hypothetical protein
MGLEGIVSKRPGSRYVSRREPGPRNSPKRGRCEGNTAGADHPAGFRLDELHLPQRIEVPVLPQVPRLHRIDAVATLPVRARGRRRQPLVGPRGGVPAAYSPSGSRPRLGAKGLAGGLRLPRGVDTSRVPDRSRPSRLGTPTRPPTGSRDLRRASLTLTGC